LPNSIKARGKSLIAFKGKEHPEVPKTDWIFFTSKNAVRFFFKAHSIPKNTRVACAGIGTAKVLAGFVQNIEFIGDQVDIQKIGSAFSELVGNDTCLFPISDISRRTIQHYFKNPENAIDFIVYATEGIDNVPKADEEILVFTSPSNVDQYFKFHRIDAHQKVIAMGSSTGKALEEKDIREYWIPQLPGEFGVVDLLHQFI
jgi:uroporphyrinogen-III synthase